MSAFQSLETDDQFSQLLEDSLHRPQIIFKHSTRCSISSMALARFNGKMHLFDDNASLWLLDLIQFREISDRIAETCLVKHESPQLLVLSAGKSVYHCNHLDIRPENIADLNIFSRD